LEIQQDKRGRYIETKLDHIEWANKLCRESLLRKSDQLTGAQRVFFERLKKYLKEQGITETNNKGFYAKAVREHFRLHTETVKRNFTALENMGLITRIGENRKLSFEYQIDVWDDYSMLQSGINLMDETLAELREKYPNA
jgi:DNA primase